MIPFIALLGLAAAAPALAQKISQLHGALVAQKSLDDERAVRRHYGLIGEVTAHYAINLVDAQTPQDVEGAFAEGAELQRLLEALERDGDAHVRCPRCGAHDIHGRARAKTLRPTR